MAFDENLATRIRDALALRRGSEEKKMFGGVGFLLNGNWEFLEDALHEQARKWLMAEVFSEASVPLRFLSAMLRAAVYEVDPSFNGYFVKPCIASHDHRVVHEALLDYVEKGSDFEKAGAVNALYWAGMTLRFDDYKRGLTLENATPESRAAYLELKDVWERKCCLLLRESCRTRTSMCDGALFRA